jgi:hypothetical protein
MHDYITAAMESQEVRGVALMAYDFSKAFDRLGHDVIVDTLREKNFPKGFTLWMFNYLSNRTQIVKMLDHQSQPLPVISGVPQGSIFGPYLFNAVIGSLQPVHRVTKIIKYIDDCTYVIPVDHTNNHVLSAEHQEISNWSKSNGLSLNLKKTKWIWIPKSRVFPPPSLPGLSPEEVVRILGVVFSSDLKWDCHFKTVVRCASKRLYALRVLRPILTKNDLKNVYQSLIRSLIEYCAPVFIGLSIHNCELLRKLQNRAHRIICNADCKCQIFEDLSSRRKASAVSFLRKIEKFPDHPLHSLRPCKSSRSGRYLQPLATTSRRRNSFFPATILILNGTFVD